MKFNSYLTSTVVEKSSKSKRLFYSYVSIHIPPLKISYKQLKVLTTVIGPDNRCERRLVHNYTTDWEKNGCTDNQHGKKNRILRIVIRTDKNQ